MCNMSGPQYRVVKDQPTSIIVELRPAVPKARSLEFLRSFADELADAIRHLNPTVQQPKRKEPIMTRHLCHRTIKIQCGTTGCNLTLEMSDHARVVPKMLTQGSLQLLYEVRRYAV